LNANWNNNSLKTTAIQALSLWNFMLERWIEERGEVSKAKKRPGVPLSKLELINPPVDDIKTLWNNRQVYLEPNRPSLIEIMVKGIDNYNKPWEFGLELQFSNKTTVFVRPMKRENTEERMSIPESVKNLKIVFLSALSGIQAFEEQLSLSSQNRRISEGRAGDVLRNLLYELSLIDELWSNLKSIIQDMFQIELCKPTLIKRSGQIIAEYHTGVRDESDKKNPHSKLDIICGGSGFLQTLLLFTFISIRPGQVILLDEPDAHLEIIRQREVYSKLSSICQAKKSQLIIATHSEVIFDEAEFEDIIAFPEGKPLGTKQEKSQFRKTLNLIPSSDYFLAKTKKRFLYSEDYTDRLILVALAQVLKHPAEKTLKNLPWKPIKGNNISKARGHFHGLQKLCPDLKACIILDRTEGVKKLDSDSLIEIIWSRREIENYLLNIDAIDRFCNKYITCGTELSIDFFSISVKDILGKYLLNAAINEPFGEHPQLMNSKASDDILVPFFEDYFRKIGMFNEMSKKNLYRLAEVFNPDEIHPEIPKVLDVLFEHLS
ncbi:MAG: AAA family ATPase, partial [Calditrichota bacterium]